MFRVVATAKIVPGKRKRVARRGAGHAITRVDGATANRVQSVKHIDDDPSGIPSRIVKTSWDKDPSVTNKKGKGKGTVSIYISMPPQMFTNLYLFARKMRMNHSHLLRTALAEMMARNGWDLTRHMEGSNEDGKTP